MRSPPAIAVRRRQRPGARSSREAARYAIGASKGRAGFAGRRARHDYARRRSRRRRRTGTTAGDAFGRAYRCFHARPARTEREYGARWDGAGRAFRLAYWDYAGKMGREELGKAGLSSR